jgi:hypothetical protein
MLVSRFVHNTELETKELVAVRAFGWGAATKLHYDTLLDMQGVTLLASSSDKSRAYIRPYLENTIGAVLLSIKARYEKTGKLGVSGPEQQELLNFLRVYKEFWVRQPTELYLVACDQIQKFYDGLKKEKHDGNPT